MRFSKLIMLATGSIFIFPLTDIPHINFACDFFRPPRGE